MQPRTEDSGLFSPGNEGFSSPKDARWRQADTSRESGDGKNRFGTPVNKKTPEHEVYRGFQVVLRHVPGRSGTHFWRREWDSNPRKV